MCVRACGKKQPCTVDGFAWKTMVFADLLCGNLLKVYMSILSIFIHTLKVHHVFHVFLTGG